MPIKRGTSGDKYKKNTKITKGTSGDKYKKNTKVTSIKKKITVKPTGALAAKPKVTKTTTAAKSKTKLSTFGEAFKAARESGKSTFKFTKNGKTSSYTTKLAADKKKKATVKKPVVAKATVKKAVAKKAVVAKKPIAKKKSKSKVTYIKAKMSAKARTSTNAINQDKSKGAAVSSGAKGTFRKPKRVEGRDTVLKKVTAKATPAATFKAPKKKSTSKSIIAAHTIAPKPKPKVRKKSTSRGMRKQRS